MEYRGESLRFDLYDSRRLEQGRFYIAILRLSELFEFRRAFHRKTNVEIERVVKGSGGWL